MRTNMENLKEGLDYVHRVAEQPAKKAQLDNFVDSNQL